MKFRLYQFESGVEEERVQKAMSNNYYSRFHASCERYFYNTTIFKEHMLNKYNKKMLNYSYKNKWRLL